VDRIPEPELMENEAQVLAYSRADFAESNAAFIRHFTALTGENFTGCALDLGCGPGDIPLRLLRAHPRATVHALDGSAAMLALARTAAAAVPSADGRVLFLQGLVPGATLPRKIYDAVMSNSLLHHLPDPSALWRMIRCRAAPGAPVVVMDLFRPLSQAAARAIVDAYAAGEPETLRHDFLASLQAAFAPDEIRDQLAAADLKGLKVRLVSDRHVLVEGTMPG
jgi:2-polyprenyl-3-methyl-5-hydroxy-6-metoxy-1,4-benzoquinol methylase